MTKRRQQVRESQYCGLQEAPYVSDTQGEKGLNALQGDPPSLNVYIFTVLACPLVSRLMG